MKNNQIKLLNFFKEDFSLLKYRGKNVKLVQEEISNDERGEIKRSVYKWSISKSILIFNHLEQIDFNDKPSVITLKNENTNFEEFEKVVKELVDLIGTDINNKGYLAQVEPSILENYHSRFWSLNKNHQNLKNQYPPEGEGYMMTLTRNKNQSELQIIGFLNLFKKEKKRSQPLTMHTRSFPAKAGNDGYAGTLPGIKKYCILSELKKSYQVIHGKKYYTWLKS